MSELSGLPIPDVIICGTSNICMPPIIAVISTYTSIGISSGNVILKNTLKDFAPSICADSNRLWSMPIIPAIRRIVVFPNHIMKFIKATMPRE
jgi:hypothetical protein